MLALVTKTIERNRMLKKGDKIVVGVSGGADSVCLLDVLNKLKDKYNLKITVVHINHCIRGQEADRDEAFVKALAEKYGVQGSGAAGHRRGAALRRHPQGAAQGDEPSGGRTDPIRHPHPPDAEHGPLRPAGYEHY